MFDFENKGRRLKITESALNLLVRKRKAMSFNEIKKELALEHPEISDFDVREVVFVLADDKLVRFNTDRYVKANFTNLRRLKK